MTNAEYLQDTNGTTIHAGARVVYNRSGYLYLGHVVNVRRTTARMQQYHPYTFLVVNDKDFETSVVKMATSMVVI